MTPAGQLALDGGRPILAVEHQCSWLSAPPPEVEAATSAQAVAEADRPLGRVGRLERRWRDVTGQGKAMAYRSGALAWHLALASLDLAPGDEVICPADAGTVIAALRRHGIEPRLVDVDLRSLHIDPQAVEAAITPRTQAVVVVDQYGTLADYHAIEALRRRHGVAIIEEASDSVGAVHHGRPAGSFGDLALFTSEPDEARTVLGRAGLVATSDDNLAAALGCSLLINHESGLDQDPSAAPLCDLDAIVVDARLRRLDEESDTRRANGTYLRQNLASVPGLWVPATERGASHVYSQFPLIVLPDELGLTEAAAPILRDAVVDALTAEGLEIDRWLGRSSAAGAPTCTKGTAGRFPVVEQLADSGLVLGGTWGLFGPPTELEAMDRIAACFWKLFVDHVDRLRELALERARPRRST